MGKFSRTGLLCFIGAIVTGVGFIALAVMFALSFVFAGRTVSPGLDLGSYNVVKMTVRGSDGLRIAGTQTGDVFAFTEDGEIVWDVGALSDKAVYDIALSGDNIYIVYADGKICVFPEAEAREFSAAGAQGAFTGVSTYSIGHNINGNVSNTQILVGEDGAFYVRAVVQDLRRVNRLYGFAPGESDPNEIAKEASPIGGMAVYGDLLYFSVGEKLFYLPGGDRTEYAVLDEPIGAVSVSGDELSVITQSSSLKVFDRASAAEKETVGLGISLDTSYIYSVGENFLAKIKNGGVALIDVASRSVTLRMAAGDKANFVLWTDDCFMLRDTSDLTNPVVIFYSVSHARSVALWSALEWVFGVLAVLFLAAAVVLAFAVKDRTRARMWEETKKFAKAVWRQKYIYIALIIPFVLLIVFYYVPMVLGFSLSFLDYIPGERSVFVAFKNFIAVFTDATFWEASLNMLVFLIADLLKALIPPFLIAELILAVRFKRFSLWVRILLFIPGILPGVATALVWSQGIFGETTNSLMNAFIGLFVPNFAQHWINNPSAAIRISSIIAFGFPWIGSYLIFYGALGGINLSIFEAAKLDGCSWFRRIVVIDIPLILAQFKYVFITSFIASVQNYGTLYILYGAEAGALIKTPALMMYGEIMRGGYGVASVMGVFLFAVLVVVSIFNFRSQREQIQ